jgi:hypothetical protein
MILLLKQCRMYWGISRQFLKSGRSPFIGNKTKRAALVSSVDSSASAREIKSLGSNISTKLCFQSHVRSAIVHPLANAALVGGAVLMGNISSPLFVSSYFLMKTMLSYYCLLLILSSALVGKAGATCDVTFRKATGSQVFIRRFVKKI